MLLLKISSGFYKTGKSQSVTVSEIPNKVVLVARVS